MGESNHAGNDEIAPPFTPYSVGSLRLILITLGSQQLGQAEKLRFVYPLVSFKRNLCFHDNE